MNFKLYLIAVFSTDIVIVNPRSTNAFKHYFKIPEHYTRIVRIMFVLNIYINTI